MTVPSECEKGPTDAFKKLGEVKDTTCPSNREIMAEIVAFTCAGVGPHQKGFKGYPTGPSGRR